MDNQAEPSSSYLKRNLSVNSIHSSNSWNSLDQPLSYRPSSTNTNTDAGGGLAEGVLPSHYTSTYRRKQRMVKQQRLSQRVKTGALLVTCFLCLLIFFPQSSYNSNDGGGHGHSTEKKARDASTPVRRLGKGLGDLFNTGGGGDDGSRFDRAHSPLKGLSNLVVVAGHSVLRYTDAANAEENESWYLEPYMEIAGQAKTFVEHIKMGIEEAARDPKTILLFSGGTTKVKAGPMTEAQSYWTVAEKYNWFGNEDVRHRAFTENFARDSFENLLFSLCRFNELTGDYPVNMAVVSYDFKRQRFAEIHREALRFPQERFTFLGSSYPEENLAKASQGERGVYEKFQNDPYGVHGELKAKLYMRDPFVQGARYTNSCPEMQRIMRYNGHEIFPGEVPWM